jgi:predicted transcriptional regulator of viral defense system
MRPISVYDFIGGYQGYNSVPQKTSFGLHLHRGDSSRPPRGAPLHLSRSRIVEQISRGLYRCADAPEIDQNLLEVAYRIPEGTLCLTTALARHGLTDNIPARIDVAIPRGNRIPTLLSPVDVRVFSKDTFELGRGEFKVGEGFAVGLYSPERSLVDMIRLRHREGTDIAWEALRRWLGRRGSKPAALIEMAKASHGAERAVRNALEIVL